MFMVKITDEREVFRTQIFSIKEIDLTFSDNQKRTYSLVEKKDSSLLVPINKDNELILIKEYFPAIDEFQLALPKGRVDKGSPLEAANKELQEETGYKAEELIHLGTVTVSPGNMRHKTHIFLARYLVESKLKGDEEETIDVIKVPFNEFEKYILNDKIQEARMIAALYLAKRYVNNNKT